MKKLYLALTTVAVLLATPALAIDFNQELKQLNGQSFTDADGKEQKTTLGQICEQALLASYPDEKELSGAEKFQRWQLATKVKGPDGNLSSEDLTKLKMLIGKAFPPLVVGQAWKMLDPGAK